MRMQRAVGPASKLAASSVADPQPVKRLQNKINSPAMTRKKILQDHKCHGKTFIPPFQHMLGPLSEISWVKTILPELLWITLIQNYHGHREGVELITRFTRIARKCSSSEKKRIFATSSALGELTRDEKSCLLRELTASGDLFDIQKPLLPLIRLYPECPLRFLYSVKPNSTREEEKQNIERLRKLVGGMYNKISLDTMMVQATAIWLAFDSGVLKVSEGLALARFPEIEKYPNTELSEKVAASIRSSIFMFFTEPHYPKSPNWPKYFWNRSLEIDQCYFEESASE